MRKRHGTKSASGWSWSTPLSACVRVTSPCTISLNIPSPPTHTTLKTRDGFWLQIHVVNRRYHGNTWMHMNAMLCHPGLPPFWQLCSHKKGPINSETCSAEAVMAWGPALLDFHCFSSWGAEGGSCSALSGEKPFSAWRQTCLKISCYLPPHAPCYYGENKIMFGSWDPHPTAFSFPAVLKGSRTLQWQ